MTTGNKVLSRIVGIVSLFAFAAGALAAEEAAHDPAVVWKRYLPASEQAALAGILADMRGGSSGDAETDAAPTPAAMREWYGKMMAIVAPAPADVPSEAFSENGVRGLWLKPANADPDKVLLYLHGGGYVVGSPATGAAIAGFLAREAGILCFSLDYPLAPETPFPAAPDNALVAYRMLLGKGFRPENVVVAGDSAGGGLALVLLTDIRGQALPMPAGAFLLSPWTDLTHGFASHEAKRLDDAVITRDFLDSMADMYAGGKDRKSSRVSPAFADLRGLPPLLIHAGSYEILLDDSLTVARNAALADVPVTLAAWPGYYHVFQMMHGKLEGGRRSLAAGAAFFDEVLGKTQLRPGYSGR